MEHPNRRIRRAPASAARRAGSAAGDPGSQESAPGGAAGALNRRGFLGLLLVSALPSAGYAAAPEAPNEPAELYRFRIVNEPGGSIELSTDGGRRWDALGSVVRAGTALAVVSDTVTVVPPGSLAGAAPEQLLIRVPAAKGQFRQLKIAAKGEALTPSAVATDLPARAPLFRSLAPTPGSRVMLERGERLAALPGSYLPRPGDRLVIVVARPLAGDPPAITIENKTGGMVEYLAPGGIPRLLARVKQPLLGIGRYAGTEHTGSGSVLSWSSTAVLVATTDRGRLADEHAEERGGFVIQPSEPGLRGITHPDSQMLIEALKEGEVKPAVSPFFGLPAPLSTGDPFDPKPTRVEVKIDGGDWEPFPELHGPIQADGMLKALETEFGGKRTVSTGITHLRILFGTLSEENFQRRVRLALTPLEPTPQRGNVKIRANVSGDGIEYVSFFLNGVQAKLTNVSPFVWEWDTSKEMNGEHLIEIRGMDSHGAVLTSVVRKVLVDN